jgi:hypothetical protein
VSNLRVVERPWDIPRRRYAVERLTIDLPDLQHWSIERFFSAPLDAQAFMASFAKGPRVLSRGAGRPVESIPRAPEASVSRLTTPEPPISGGAQVATAHHSLGADHG